MAHRIGERLFVFIVTVGVSIPTSQSAIENSPQVFRLWYLSFWYGSCHRFPVTWLRFHSRASSWDLSTLVLYTFSSNSSPRKCKYRRFHWSARLGVLEALQLQSWLECWLSMWEPLSCIQSVLVCLWPWEWRGSSFLSLRRDLSSSDSLLRKLNGLDRFNTSLPNITFIENSSLYVVSYEVKAGINASEAKIVSDVICMNNIPAFSPIYINFMPPDPKIIHTTSSLGVWLPHEMLERDPSCPLLLPERSAERLPDSLLRSSISLKWNTSIFVVPPVSVLNSWSGPEGTPPGIAFLCSLLRKDCGALGLKLTPMDSSHLWTTGFKQGQQAAVIPRNNSEQVNIATWKANPKLSFAVAHSLTKKAL